MAADPGAQPSAAELEFFEKEVRPLLAANCGECHGAQEQWAGLRLDSRESMLRGGESGSAIAPGDPEKSLLIAAVRQSGELQMPPDGKLEDQQIAILEKWVALGAPWPASDVLADDERAVAQRRHWAFQPIAQPALPEVSDSGWCRTPVDRFVLAALDERGLKPSAPADRRTLIRRVSYDLTGLPPTPAEVEAFVHDDDPEAYAKLVERLLSSPHYGEHWARHWLDVARYSDTKGYVYAREERVFVHAAAYRDWVVRAFNEDLAYDRFLLLQMAADQAAPDDPASLAAMGFLTLGRHFLGVNVDIIDDRIDVVTRGTLGLTVACARCHDHKYDPIPTADYYSLFGVFENSAERLVPLPTTKCDDEKSVAYEKELQSRKAKLSEGLASARDDAAKRVRERLPEYLAAQLEIAKYPEEAFNQVYSKADVIPKFVHHWAAYLRRAGRANDPIFVPWSRFAGLTDEEFAGKAPQIANELAAAGDAVHPLVRAAFGEPPASMREVAERYAKLFLDVERQWQELVEHASAEGKPDRLPDPAAEALRQVLYAVGSPCVVPNEEIVSTEQFFDTDTINSIWKLQGDVERWLNEAPDAATHTVALLDRATLKEPRILRRGNPAAKGDEVPRQFLKALSLAERQPFQQGSGRLELARAIVAPDNPLTSRVWANRVWAYHFGAGLVKTPSDFGLRAEAPSHPELLDWLAQQLLTQGWSTKHLHRAIVLSNAYQQASTPELGDEAQRAAHETAKLADPENRLLWRMNPRRLSFEEWRDTLLASSGELDVAIGGRAKELFPANGENVRRTLYGLVDRQFLNPALRVFDFANPDLHIPQRSETTVSQQALFGMNHPFVAARARSLVAAVDAEAGGDPVELAARLYRAVYQREPSAVERQAALDFLANAAADAPPAPPAETLTWSYGYGEVLAAEGRVTFAQLPHFSGAAWQGGAQWPDAALGWVQLTADGGHAGNDLQHAAVRRWTAPHRGEYRIKSTAQHEVAAGDGIRCWIVSSRQGVLQTQTLHEATMPLEVDAVALEAGDTIDFVVDFNADLNSDQYLWKATIEEIAAPAGDATAGANATATAAATWDSTRDFANKSPQYLDPWHQLAQVLLLSNELMFVD
ncbi:PSD1 and planctomycete cytochrome C domain-containing protein [Lacipirellula limnantheis]|uniref:PSD1 and planctomycete cytochrome C domain-containing protein n=1 Tax=Lacipirellula limnantheis TaxID=2528024 RepID=UPI001AF0213A|nr:PSD1 and planctomycete cytochrome C domain-containing protein [Lacipirellula limnantheis]